VEETHFRFSIVTPTYNRPDRLKRYLEALTRLHYDKDQFEVVLVDDGSDVPTRPVAEGFAGQLNITYLQQNHGGVAKGRHLGAENSRGIYLAFTDDDCVPSPDWLTHLEAALDSTPNAAAGGFTTNALPDNPYSEASQVLITYLYQNFNQDSKQAKFFTANNAALPRDLYFEVGGLDTSWPFCGEDRDLWERWRAAGHPMVYAPEAVVEHYHDLDIQRFRKQHFNYGRGARRLRKTAAQADAKAVPFERLMFYCCLPLAAFRQLGGWRSWHVAALLGLSQVWNTLGYVDEWRSPSNQAPTWKVEAARMAR
jgi:GT2 family glycosyltransferase